MLIAHAANCIFVLTYTIFVNFDNYLSVNLSIIFCLDNEKFDDQRFGSGRLYYHWSLELCEL